MKRKGKRILIASDTHCGHRVGLTPESAWDGAGTKFGDIQRELWAYYTEFVDEHRPYDIMLFNGDAIDGRGERSGGTELLTTNREEQCNIARAVLEYPKAKTIRMTYGTPYHVGREGEDWEHVLAAQLGATIEGHGYYAIEGVVFDMKHKIGPSSIPHGRLTALAREILWAQQWHLLHNLPLPKVLIRSHVHYFEQMHHAGTFGIITPSLQGLGSKYGVRECSGTVDFGVCVMDVSEGEITYWKPMLAIGETQKPQLAVL